MQDLMLTCAILMAHHIPQVLRVQDLRQLVVHNSMRRTAAG